MKKRFISMLLALVMALSMIPSAFAASTEEEALGEVDIYSGGDAFSYLMMNGKVQSQRYTYYNYVSKDGTLKEIPAYCVNPNKYGVPQTVAKGESIKYTASEKSSDPKIMGIVANGYPTRSLEELGLENKEQAYYATKMALWCYIIGSWDISNLKVNPALTGDELVRANKMLAAAKDIYRRGTMWDKVYEPNLNCVPDRSTAYPVTVDGKQYKQQVFTFTSETWICNYAVSVGFADPSAVPKGTRIVDMNNRDITTLTTADIGNSFGGQFKILYPADSIQGKNGSVQLNLTTQVYRYGIYYAVCAEKSKYGDLQNYMCDTDPTTEMQLSTLSNYADIPVEEMDTGLRIIKRETGTNALLSGALFEVIAPNGDTIGTFSTNEEGLISIPLDLVGNFTVIERQAAPNHKMGSVTIQNVTVEYGKVATVAFYNDPYGSLRVQKISDTGEYLPGVTVQVKNINTGAVFSKKTGAAGVAIFDVEPGAYEVKELAGISGWKADTDTVQTVNVVTGETSAVTITNKELPGLRIVKYERGTMTALSNVSFEIFRDNVSQGIFKTDAFGEILLTDCKEGTWKVVEVDTGDTAHILVTTPQEVELRAGDGIKELYFFNDLKPGMRLIKVDSNDPSKGIPNAVFEIKSVDGTYGPKEFQTDQSGEIDLSELPAKAMIVTEKSCPGYIIDEAQRIIQLQPNTTAQFVFTNKKLPTLTLTKLSSDGTPLAGVTYRLAKIEDGSRYLDRTTSTSGQIVWEGLDSGVYSLQEISTVETHILDKTEHHVELFPGKDSTIVLENDRRPNLYIEKRCADDGSLVEGAVYLVKAADSSTVTEVKTGADGVAKVENLLPGVFEVIEKSVPSPLLLDSPSKLVTLHPNRDTTVYFENHRAPTITIIKENEITHERMANVRFRVSYKVMDSDKGDYRDLGYFTTDENGLIYLSRVEHGIEDGWFKVEEVEAPAGFALTDSSVQEAFVESGKSKTFTVQNRPLSAIVVWKYDSVSGAALPNCWFQLRYLSGNTSGTGGTVVGTYKTSANGSFTVSGLQSGSYIIEELSSDGTHVIDTPPQTVYLSGNQQDVVEVYFGNAPKGNLLITKVSTDSKKTPLAGVEFLVTTADGTMLGNQNGKYVTDSAGSFLVENVAPGTTLVVKEVRAKEGYLLDETPQSTIIRAGQTVTLEFRNQPLGNLVIEKLGRKDGKTIPLAGVKFEVKYANGQYVDVAGGKQSSNGIYYTDANGKITLSGIVGTVVVTEQESIEGFTIDPNTRSQTVTINPDDTQTLRFYNNAVGGIEIIKVNAADKSERIPNVTFEIRKADGAYVDTVTTDRRGRAYLSLEDGAYYGVETSCPKGFKVYETPFYFTIRGGATVTKTIANKPFSGIIIHKISSTTGEGIYGAKFVLYDSSKKPIGEYTTDQQGYIYIDDLVSSGSARFYLRELEAAPGYELDKEYKTVYVKDGKTIEVEWENTPITGQIQVYKFAAETNPITGTPAGAPLQGAVYEISEARSGKVVDYITTDARGVAASKPLPLNRYKIREITAPAYWQVDTTVFDETLEYPGQIMKLSAYDKPAKLGVSITKRSNAEVLAGSQMRYDITVANTSNVPLESFFWHDRIPTDAARATTLTTGTYSARLTYRILYKTNYTANYQVLASNLLTSNNYSFALNAIPMQAGEVVTDVYFDFGTVPVGFQSVTGPTLSVQVLTTVANGYQLVNRADAGGKYQGTWQTAQASWVTIIRKYTTTPTLPKTGY